MSLQTIRALALETTSRRGEVALVQGGRIVAVDAFEAGLKHTAHLLPLIDRLCRSLDWSAASIGEIYVSVGPGGFTGTRIGVTFAKAIAFAGGLRVVAVPTPRVIVENAPAEAVDALVVVDARRGKVWVETFARVDAAWQATAPGRLTTLPEAICGSPRPIWLMGEGVAYHTAEMASDDAGILISSATQPRAEVVARLGWDMARRGKFTDSFALAPAYVRRPEAEEKRLGTA